MGRGRGVRTRERLLIILFIHLSTSDPSARAQPRYPTETLGDPARSTAVVESAAGPAPGDILLRETLIEEVLARNPSLVATRAAERAARARVAPARAFDDLMVSYSLAPLSITSDRVPFGHSIELRQALPFPGKRGLRADVARAEERVLDSGLEEARQQLALSASQLYDQYFFAHRALAINAQHVALMESIKHSAEAQYAVGRASQQDALQAEVELGQLLREQLTLRTEVETLTAQLNAIAHRQPQTPLPPPVEALDAVKLVPRQSEQLQAEAVARRPELEALRARLGGGEAARKLAELGYYPDLSVMGSYNSMWMDRAHQVMVGASLSLPIFQLAARRAQVEGARAALENVRATEAELLDRVRAEIHQARAQLIEAQAAVVLYRTRVLPASRDQVAAARAGFASGRNSFQAVIAAERSLRTTELQLAQGIAATHSRYAALRWAVGQFPAPVERAGSPPGPAEPQPAREP